MPVLKVINGHTGCGNIQRYLEKNGRALARDFYNLSWDDREMPDADDFDKPDVQWAAEMDQLRALYGNDASYGGRKAITYRHYILSPSPRDKIELDSLREITRAWTLEHFADYQVAIVYHDDNEHCIPHAHIVMNNTNVETGKRLHIPNPKQLNRDLQEMAKERDLVQFDNDNHPPVVNIMIESHREVTNQAHYRSRAERAIEREGGYSWVADIRSRAEVALGLSASTAEYEKVLGALGVSIADNSRNAKHDDWIYSFADTPSRKVSGGKLGSMFTKSGVKHRFNGGSFEGTTKRQILGIAKNAIELKDMHELDYLSELMTFFKDRKITSISDLNHEAAHHKKCLANSHVNDSKELHKQRIEYLEKASEFARSRKMLPEKPPAYIVESRKKQAEHREKLI